MYEHRRFKGFTGTTSIFRGRHSFDLQSYAKEANVVADALSRKSYAKAAQVATMLSELCAEFEQLNLGFVTNAVELVIEPTLEQEIHKGQLQDAKLKEIAENIMIGKAPGFRVDENGTLWFGKRLCVPKNKAIRDAVLREAQEFAYSIHPGSTKMYLDLKEKYWWYGHKRDVAEYVALCDTCHRVKVEHQSPA